MHGHVFIGLKTVDSTNVAKTTKQKHVESRATVEVSLLIGSSSNEGYLASVQPNPDCTLM